ncbi:MAG: DUF488 domain-containing protein [Pseudomonadota bacterium]
MRISVKRVYETPGGADGTRVLVDRLWPRGLSKERAAIDHWFKDIAPSDELRKWFGHDPARWAEFRRRYYAELDEKQDALMPLRQLIGQGPVTLLFAARDDQHNNAVVLREYLADR